MLWPMNIVGSQVSFAIRPLPELGRDCQCGSALGFLTARFRCSDLPPYHDSDVPALATAHWFPAVLHVTNRLSSSAAKPHPMPFPDSRPPHSAEHERLREASAGEPGRWRFLGPYLSERAWGTVREDYSAAGSAWEYFPHDQARSRTYRWSEDGLAGVCDLRQRLCLALAFWNGRDPILKERI